MIEEIKEEGYENVIGVFISSKLSSTCHTAHLVFLSIQKLTRLFWIPKISRLVRVCWRFGHSR